MSIDKIIQLNVKNVYTDIMAFVNDKGINSEHTKVAYEKDIRHLFKSVLNKEIEELKPADLILTRTQILKYKHDLTETYSAVTVNRMISTIRSLFKELSIDYPTIKPEIFNVGRIKEQVNSYGTLSPEEAETMIKLAKTLRNGEEKSLLIELAVYTSIRLSALLSAKWSNIENIDGHWIVKIYDKGKKLDDKPIDDDLYSRLQTLKNDNPTIFSMNQRTAERTIKELAKQMDIPEDRNITFHSLKKVAINWVIDTTGDIIKAAEQGNHANIQTTYRNYIKRKKDYGSMAGIVMKNGIDLSKLEGMTKEEIVEVIKGCSLSTRYEISKKIKG